MQKIYLLLSMAKKYNILILILSLIYGYELIFPAFGPVLNRLHQGNNAFFFSNWSLLFLIISFTIKPMHFEAKKNYTLLLASITCIATLFFAFLPYTVKLIVLALFGFTVGRFTVIWSRMFLKEVPKHHRGQVICIILFISYGILYLGNVFIPSLPVWVSTIIPALLILFSAILLNFYTFSKPVPNLNAYSQEEKSSFPWVFFIIIVIIYITAGITYTSVYPQLLSYKILERYYNVLPFLITVPFAGLITDLKGRKLLLYIGLTLLGFSFIFFTLKESVLTYFLTQTTLQSGWAFIDVYVWVVAADLAKERKRPEIHVYGIAALLIGTTVGSATAIMLRTPKMTYSFYYDFLTYLPLFSVFIFSYLLPETLSTKERDFNKFINNISHLQKLTVRELEIVELIYKDLDNKEIASTLFISNNTLKTHMRNINRKLDITNKKEIKKYLPKHKGAR